MWASARDTMHNTSARGVGCKELVEQAHAAFDQQQHEHPATVLGQAGDAAREAGDVKGAVVCYRLGQCTVIGRGRNFGTFATRFLAGVELNRRDARQRSSVSTSSATEKAAGACRT